MKPLEIFRPGTHVAMSGAVCTITGDDLAFCASNYDPKVHEAPIVVGHPTHDAPAYGWVKSLEFRDGVLLAHPDQVEQSFAEAVNSGRYKKLSAAFYTKGSQTNPRPGGIYLRHVGALGAMPPAVKGMRDAAFADEGAEILQFNEFSGWEADMRAREAALVREKTAFRLETLVKAGRVLPKERAGLMAFAEAMGQKDAPTLEFADVGGGTMRTSPLDYVLNMLEDRPPAVYFGEFAASPDLAPAKTRLVSVPRGWGVDEEGMETLQRIQDYMEQNKCDYTTAMLAVCGG